MKHATILLLATLCTTAYSQILTPEQQHIPGRYEYVHSWDYRAPDGNGTIHCDEEGVLNFYPDGTYADTAFQRHTLKMDRPIRTVMDWLSPDTLTISTYDFDFHYICPGRWRVEKGKFLFSEHSEGFNMFLLNESINQWIIDYASGIEVHTLPNSSRWFTFDIERLDEEWFIWTYTYPNGRKDSWEMKRTRQ